MRCCVRLFTDGPPIHYRCEKCCQRSVGAVSGEHTQFHHRLLHSTEHPHGFYLHCTVTAGGIRTADNENYVQLLIPRQPMLYNETKEEYFKTNFLGKTNKNQATEEQ